MTSWRYCFYDSAIDDNDYDEDDVSYGAKLIVYRRSSPTTNNYVPVLGSITTIQLTRGISSNFRCQSATVAQRFEIQENDVIAACIWDQDDVHPLYLVGNTNNPNAAQELYQYDRIHYDDCTSSQINTVNTSHSDFRRREDFRLHLYANIGMYVYIYRERSVRNKTARQLEVGLGGGGVIAGLAECPPCSLKVAVYQFTR